MAKFQVWYIADTVYTLEVEADSYAEKESDSYVTWLEFHVGDETVAAFHPDHIIAIGKDGVIVE